MPRKKIQIDKERGAVDWVIAVVMGLAFMLAVGVGTYSAVHKMGQVNDVLSESAKRVGEALRTNGCITQTDQTNIASYLNANGLDPSQVYFNASTSREGFGSTSSNGAVGYNFDVEIPWINLPIYHQYLEKEVPNVQSTYVTGMTSDNSVCSGTFTTFAGTQNANTDLGPTTVANTTNPGIPTSVSLTGPSTVTVGQSADYTGTVNMGATPAPAGTQVTVNSPSGQLAVTTQGNGTFKTTQFFSSVGPKILSASSGIGSASQTITVTPNSPTQIVFTNAASGSDYNTIIGANTNIQGVVTDTNGNPIPLTSVSVTADTSDVPSQNLTTNSNGSFSLTYTPKALGTQHITFSAGSISATANISVLQGTPQSITLESSTGSSYNTSPLTITAGQIINLRGKVNGPYNSAISGADIAIASSTNGMDNFTPNGAVKTDSTGSYADPGITMTLAGTHYIQAATGGLNSTAQVQVTVNPAAPAKVVNLQVNPVQIGAGGTITVTGTVQDTYGNAISGTSLTIVGPDTNTTVTTQSGGLFTATQKLTTPGTATLKVQANGTTLQGGTINVNVLPSGSYSLSINLSSSQVTAGDSVTATITLKDNTGAPVSGKKLTLSETPEPSALVQTSVTTDSTGQVVVNVGPVTKMGYESLTATMDGVANVIGTSTFQVLPGAPAQVIANVSPSTTQVYTDANPVPLPIISGTVTDSYMNPINGAIIGISGGYGANATGTSDNNGYFAIDIKPTNIGGPYTLHLAITSKDGSMSADPCLITVVASMSSKITLTPAVSGQNSIPAGEPYYVVSTLSDMYNNPINNETVSLASITDTSATITNAPPSGPDISGVGSIQQTTGTYLPGASGAFIVFDTVGTQALTSTYTKGSSSFKEILTVHVTPSTVSNMLWSSVSPTTVQAGNSIIVTGQAVNLYGQGVPDGKPITISILGSNATNQTAYTNHSGSGPSASYGYFSAVLTPTKVGTYPLQITADGNTYSFGTSITVNPGPVASGTITYSSSTVYTGNNNTITIHIQDAWANGVPNKSITMSCTATSGGVAPNINQPGATDFNGNTSILEGPFSKPGTYTYNAIVDGINLATSSFTVQQSSWTFIYTGTTQTFTAPFTGTFNLELWGAQGGGPSGGKGGYATGTINLTQGTSLYLYVGGQGKAPLDGYSGGLGGWNGGGNGAPPGNTPGSGGLGGGGATDLRTIGGTWNDSSSLSARIVVAAGGGGDHYGWYGGDGGGLNGLNGETSYSGKGGTQSAGGSSYGGFGYGGAGRSSGSSTYGGSGGGSGYYGGGGGNAVGGGSGGGGSSYAGGAQGGATSAGLNTGNGKIVITALP